MLLKTGYRAGNGNKQWCVLRYGFSTTDSPSNVLKRLNTPFQAILEFGIILSIY